MARTRQRRVNLFAVSVGAMRLASGVSFLVAPEAANRLWGDAEDSGPTASLLLRSMGYRDALIGGLLVWSGLRGSSATAGWFLASAGADAADLLGGVANQDRMTAQQRIRGLGRRGRRDRGRSSRRGEVDPLAERRRVDPLPSPAMTSPRPRRDGAALLPARRIGVRRALPEPRARPGRLVGLARGRARSASAGEETNAATFFDGLDVHFLDSTDAVRTFEAGGDAIAAPAADAPVVRGPRRRPRRRLRRRSRPSSPTHLAAVWEAPFRAAGADRRRRVPPPPPHAAARRCVHATGPTSRWSCTSTAPR